MRSNRPYHFRFHTFYPVKVIFQIVNLPTSSLALITSSSNILFNFIITLNNVLCVPSFRLNLMSISKITNALRCYAIFFSNFCILSDLDLGRMIGSGKQQGGLYYMSPLQQTPISHQVSQPPNLWHMRLGHPSPHRLKLASNLIPSNVISFDNNCMVFPMVKQRRLPFPSSSITTKSVIYLLHCDI